MALWWGGLHMGYDLKIDDMAFESILAAVSSGKAEFGAAGMTVTDERKESVDFTDIANFFKAF